METNKEKERNKLLNNNLETDKEKKREDLLNKLLNKSYVILSFSVPREDFPILEKFSEIVKREAGSRGFSKVLVKAMAEYVHRHGVGNPQLLLTHYIRESEPSPMRVMCNYIHGATSEGLIFCRKPGVWQWIKSVKCYSCKENMLRKTV